jgi:hypothetical protein
MTNFTNAAQENKARKAANKSLASLASYHPFLPISYIDAVLAGYGFAPLEEAVYCGREGRMTQQVGARTWIAMSWYKMESGRYEIVAYLS